MHTSMVQGEDANQQQHQVEGNHVNQDGFLLGTTFSLLGGHGAETLEELANDLVLLP